MIARRCLGAFVAVLSLAQAGCRQGAPTLEVRTFPIEHGNAFRIAELISPYVYDERPDAPGAASWVDGAITVRETPDNLDRIGRVVADYDKPLPTVQLTFQILDASLEEEAGDAGPRDERTREVEAALRGALRFRSYRLVGETMVAAADGSDIMQALPGPGGQFIVTAEVHHPGSSRVRLEDVTFVGPDGQVFPRTTVNVEPGQTLVLGWQTYAEERALILTLRADEVG